MTAKKTPRKSRRRRTRNPPPTAPVGGTNTLQPTTRRSLRLAIAAGILVVLPLIAYIPAMQAGYIWDDDSYVTENETLTSTDGLGDIWFSIGATPQYYPLVFTSFWLEYRLWRLDPAGYHAVNVLLHVINAILLWLVLRRLALPGAWLAAALFAVHPVHVESVAWITERKNILSGVFYLSTLLMYLRFVGIGSPPGDTQRRWHLYGLGTVFFVAALLSKTVTCTLPAVIVLLLWWKRDRLRRTDVVPLVPWLMIGVAMGLLTMALERGHVGAQGEEWNLSGLERCLLAGRIVWFYLYKLVWPTNLTFIYPRWHVDATSLWWYLFPVTAMAVVGRLTVLRHRVGKGPLVAALFFGGTLVPALGFIDVYPMRYSFVADHFQYLASIGPIALVAALVARAYARVGRTPRGTAAVYAPAAVVLVALATLTWHQSKVYADAETLWRDTLAKNDTAAIAHINLGNILAQRGEPMEAQAHYERAIEIKPNAAEAYTGLGLIAARQGRLKEAVTLFRKRLELHGGTPQAHTNLATALAESGDLASAREQFLIALRLDEHFLDARRKLGAVCMSLGRFDEAVVHFERWVAQRPNDAQARRALAAARAAASGQRTP